MCEKPTASRRSVLRSGAMLATMGLAGAVHARVARAETGFHGGSWTGRFTGHSPFGHDQWAYLPFDVGPGATGISVTSSFEEFSVPGVTSNVLDLGLFGPPGWDVGDAGGFRGWSGGARRDFAVSWSDATPGYLAGPIDEGSWAVALGPVVINPLGMSWEVTVRVDYGQPGAPARPSPAPVRVPGRGPAWYRGDLHLHTVHSDGTRTPEEMLAAARAARLDFFASTEHNTSSANHVWGRYVPDDFLVIAGEEVTTRHGHWLAVGLPWQSWIDWRYGPQDAEGFRTYAQHVRQSGGLVAAAHPGVPLPGSWWEFGFDDVDAIEVWNSAWGPEDEAALGMWNTRLLSGRRVAALANSDSHRPDQPVGMPQTVVHAEELSASAIVDGIRRGRVYLAESADVVLDVSAWTADRSAGIGEQLVVPRAGEVSFSARVSGVPNAAIVLHSAHGPLATAFIDQSGQGALRWRGRGADAEFLRVEVRRDAFTRLVALSNPIWLASDR